MQEEIYLSQHQDTEGSRVASLAQIAVSICVLTNDTAASLKLKAAGHAFTSIVMDGLEEDLLQEAFTLTWKGTYKWYLDKQPSFFLYILSTMRSIAWKWKQNRYAKTRQPVDEQELTEKAAQRGSYTSHKTQTRTDDQLEIKAFWKLLLAELIHHPVAHQVLTELIQGKEREEIQAGLGIDEKTYESARRQIKRVAKKMVENGKIWIPKSALYIGLGGH